jgi:maltooligosyltrehalose trehalohydrolase
MITNMKLGATYKGNDQCSFIVWAPEANVVELKFISPLGKSIPMYRTGRGYWKVETAGVKPGTTYMYVLDRNTIRPDPASNYQPDGVHKASQVIDHTSFLWEDTAWRGIDLAEYVIYELHVGTFTPEGTFNAIIPKLNELQDLGITAIELMPVAQFPGNRNWGYDGVYPYAVQNSYGTPDDLKKLINECHKKGIAVILDVVYNHLGPEGNYLRDFGKYFTNKYTTPWGEALNFDDEYSDEVKKYFIDNALYWFEQFHIDALRLDAVHAIYDMSARHILQCLAESTKECSRKHKRKFYLIAESDLNDTRIIQSPELGGYGIDAQWSDDFHHSVHAFLTGEQFGYFKDFGNLEHLTKAIKYGFVYDGQYSEFRKRSHGNSSLEVSAEQYVICTQNHDQVGNRMLGERLSTMLSFDSLKLTAGMLLTSPYIPLLFMGEEYGEDNPFLYFVSHADLHLVDAVRKGRQEEFSEFHGRGVAPDPQDEKTFDRSRLDHSKKNQGHHKVLINLYKKLLILRREIPALSHLNKRNFDVFGFENDRILVVRRWKDDDQLLCIFNMSQDTVTVTLRAYKKNWRAILNSADGEWGGNVKPTENVFHPDDNLTIEGFSFILLRNVD